MLGGFCYSHTERCGSFVRVLERLALLHYGKHRCLSYAQQAQEYQTEITHIALQVTPPPLVLRHVLRSVASVQQSPLSRCACTHSTHGGFEREPSRTPASAGPAHHAQHLSPPPTADGANRGGVLGVPGPRAARADRRRARVAVALGVEEEDRVVRLRGRGGLRISDAHSAGARWCQPGCFQQDQ